MFTWKKEFELGILSIDNQHKRLIEIGNRINELLTSSTDGIDTYNQIIVVIEELKDYTAYHFKTEEELFLKYNYPDYDHHKEIHDRFINYIDAIDLQTAEVNQIIFLRELLNKILSWIFNHIITEDYMYKEFLITLVK